MKMLAPDAPVLLDMEQHPPFDLAYDANDNSGHDVLNSLLSAPPTMANSDAPDKTVMTYENPLYLQGLKHGVVVPEREGHQGSTVKDLNLPDICSGVSR